VKRRKKESEHFFETPGEKSIFNYRTLFRPEGEKRRRRRLVSVPTTERNKGDFYPSLKGEKEGRAGVD